MSKIKLSMLAILLCLIAAVGLMGGCAGSGTTTSAERGHLVIVGGGLEDDNAAVFNRFVELCADGPIGIIPTSSFDAVESGVSNVARWKKYSGTREVIAIPLTKDDAAKADDPAIAAVIASCGGLWFTGGDQSRTTAVMRPEGRRTAVLDACFKVLDRGGVIGGTSAGAAIMSDPMITGGRSNSARSRDPENEDNRRVTTARGLGFLSRGLTDQHFVQRGRLGRLIDAMHDTSEREAFAVSENCALVVNRTTGDLEAFGADYAVWVLRDEGATPSKTDAAEVRIAILSTGDRAANLSRGEVLPARGLQDIRTSGVNESRKKVHDVWALGSIRPALDALATARSANVTIYDDRTSLTFFADDSTRVFVGIPGRTPCFANIRVRVEPAPR